MYGRSRRAVLFLFAFVILLGSSVSSCASPRTVEGEVTRVIDGDTVTLTTREGTKLRVRLYGIDAPEVRHEEMAGQPYGKEAKQALTALALGRRVTVEIVDIDAYRRTVGIVRRSGADINLSMVRSGYAWAYRRYLSAPYASRYLDAEREARGKRLGLWKDANPDPPWEFKKRDGNRVETRKKPATQGGPGSVRREGLGTPPSGRSGGSLLPSLFHPDFLYVGYRRHVSPFRRGSEPP
ncbi:MAG: thermonuclease family protein [Candidatus Deferrimicrobiaceae bacterium]